MAESTLTYSVKADTGQASVELKKFQDDLKNTGDIDPFAEAKKSLAQLETSVTQVKTAYSQSFASINDVIQANAKELKTAGAALGVFGAAITAFLGFSVKAFSESEFASAN